MVPCTDMLETVRRWQIHLTYLAVVDFRFSHMGHSKRIIKGFQGEYASNVSRVEAIEESGPCDSDKEVKEAEVEYCLGVRPCVFAEPDTGTACHCDDMD